MATMIWLISALAAPVLQGVANVLDNYLANKLFKNLWTLTFYSTLLNFIFLPIIFIFQIPSLPPPKLLPLFLIVGFIQIFYLVPYYKALQKTETSIITALFSLGRIFIPLFAFLLVQEILQPIQYAGFFIIIAASVALSLKRNVRFKFDESFFYMLMCSIALAIEAVIYKYLFETVSWSTGLVWPLLFSFCIALLFLLAPALRRDIFQGREVFRRNLPIFALEEMLTFLGMATSLYAISIAPVTLVKSVGSLQAFFVLLYALLFHKLFPGMFKEAIDRKSLAKKCLLFALMAFGVFLTLQQAI